MQVAPWEKYKSEDGGAQQQQDQAPWEKYATDSKAELQENTKREGTYQMVAKDGSVLHVPFSRVLDTGKQGYSITPEDFKTFVKDYTHSKGIRAEIDQALSPEDESTWKGMGLNVLKGTASGLVSPFIHPEQTAISTGRNLEVGGFNSTGAPGIYNLAPEAATKATKEALAPERAEVEKEGQEMRKTPIYGVSQVVGPAIVTEGLARAVPHVPGMEYVRSLKDRAAENVRESLQNKFGAGEDFAEKKTGEFGEDTEKARTAGKSADEKTEQQRGRADDINAERARQHQEKLQEHGEKLKEQKAAHGEKVAKWEKKRAATLQGHQDATKKVQADNAKALQDHLHEVEEVAKGNAAAQGITDARQGLEKQIADQSTELNTRIEKAEKDAKQADDTAWAAWRNKLANVNVDLSPVSDVIKSQEDKMNPQQVAEFRDILKEHKKTSGGKDTLDKAAQQAFGANYDALQPHQKVVIDTDLAQRGISVSGNAVPETPVTRLHGWKTQLEGAVRKSHDGNVLHAIGQVLDSVRKLEDDVSAQHGAQAELDAARELHGPYKDAFINSPTEPATVASAFQKKVIPDFSSEKQLKEWQDNLAHYDPDIAKLAEQVTDAQKRLDALPSDMTARGMVKPAPTPPEPKPLPTHPEIDSPPAEPTWAQPPKEPSKKPYSEPNPRPSLPKAESWTPERRAILKKNIQKYGAVGQWATRLILGTVGEVALNILTGHATTAQVGRFGSGLLIGQGAMRLFSNIMLHDSVLDWMANPSPEDVQIINTLPLDEAERLRTAVMGLRDAEIKGNPKADIKVAPSIATFLGGSSADSTHTDAKPMSLDEIRKEAEKRKPTPVAGSQMSGSPSYTHYFDPSSGKILPVAS